MLMKKTIFLFVLFNLIYNAHAQNQDSSFYAQVDLANRWIWRGVSYSESPVIQPSLGYAKNKSNFLIWASYPFQPRAYCEVDFTFEYQVLKKLKLGVTDFFAVNDSLGAKQKFFNFERETTSHMVDIYFVYTPFKKIPVSFLGSFWLWGADRNPITLEQNFSTYFELKYDYDFKYFRLSTFAGMTPWKGFYAPEAALVNVGVGLTKLVPIGKSFSIPLKVEFILNPYGQNVYINGIISIK